MARIPIEQIDAENEELRRQRDILAMALKKMDDFPSGAFGYEVIIGQMKAIAEEALCEAGMEDSREDG